jgi:hypothetical protein
MAGPEPFITDQQAEKALDYLRDSAVELGLAKFRCIMTDRMAKRKRATVMSSTLLAGMSMAAKEKEADMSEEMLNAWEEEAYAAQEYEVLRSRRDAAMAKIDAWRSLCASYRAMSK